MLLCVLGSGGGRVGITPLYGTIRGMYGPKGYGF